jgi:hypothetical protein
VTITEFAGQTREANHSSKIDDRLATGGGITMVQSRSARIKQIALLGTMMGLLGGGVEVHQAIAAESWLTAASNAQVQVYGEDEKAEQVGKGYVVFQQLGTKVVGALYYPQSEYSCFVGTRTPSQFNLVTFEANAQNPQELTIPLSTLRTVGEVGASKRQVLSACFKEAALFQHKGFSIAGH